MNTTPTAMPAQMYTHRQLAARYHVSWIKLQKWLREFENEIAQITRIRSYYRKTPPREFLVTFIFIKTTFLSPTCYENIASWCYVFIAT
jgi:DNA-binding Lrp family transcriptional regulator